MTGVFASLADRLIAHVSRRAPDFQIGGSVNPYCNRWWVIPRNRWFNIYLHEFVRDDDDRALHDHPWWNISIVLRGGYGVYRSRLGANGLTQNIASPPFAALVFAVGSDNAPANLQNPLWQPIPTFPSWPAAAYSPVAAGFFFRLLKHDLCHFGREGFKGHFGVLAAVGQEL